LKHFAEATEGIENASMLYDRHLMQPLFMLSIGNPGSSFAIEIARKIGLPEEVIKYAEEKAGSDYIDFDKHLQDIARDKRYWETKRQNIRLKEKELDRLTERYGEDLKSIDKQRKTLLKEAKTEAETLVTQANAQIENTIRKIRESQAQKEKTREARAELEQFKQAKLAAEAEREDMIARKIKQIQDRQERKKMKNEELRMKNSGQPSGNSPLSTLHSPLNVGDSVLLKGQSAAGQILDIQGKTATVAFGNLKSTVKIDRLERSSHNKMREARAQNIVPLHTDEIRKQRLNFATELDIRGLRADEALQTLMFFIDEALMFDAERVRVLHGTGTGALRQIVRDYLSKTKDVKHFADEHVQFGGAGITVVEF
jgi:DNA mismatch repair protein MutS2